MGPNTSPIKREYPLIDKYLCHTFKIPSPTLHSTYTKDYKIKGQWIMLMVRLDPAGVTNNACIIPFTIFATSNIYQPFFLPATT